MSAPASTPVLSSKPSQPSQTSSFDSARSSSSAAAAVDAPVHKESSFKSFAKKIRQAARDHHRSVQAAHNAYYGSV